MASSDPTTDSESETGGGDNANEISLAAAIAAAAREDGTPVDIALEDESNGLPVSYQILNGPDEGSASLNGTTLTFDPGEDFQDLAARTSRNVTIVVQGTEEGGETLPSETVTVTVAGTNDAPTLEGASAAAEEGGEPVAVDLSGLGDDIDNGDDGTTLKYNVTGAPEAGTASIDGTTLTFDPGEDFGDLGEGDSQDVTITVEATDSRGESSGPAEIVVTVAGQNNPPAMEPGATAAEEDGPSVALDLSTLASDTDDDPASLNYSIVAEPTEGSASINGSTLAFDPGEDFQDLSAGETRDVIVTVQADDGNDSSEPVDITVTVSGVNDAPTLEGTTANSEEDGGPVAVDLAPLGDDTDSEDDGSSLKYAIVTPPEAGTASINGSTLTFDPGDGYQELAAGETEELSIEVQATDKQGEASDVATVAVTVTGVNDAPTLLGTEGAAEEDGPTVDVDLSSLGADADAGDALSYAIITPPAEGSASINGNTLSFDPGEDFQDLSAGETRDVIVAIQATDSQDASSEPADVVITVTGTNDVPTLEGAVASAEEDGPTVTVDLATLADDADSENDGGSLSYAILAAPNEGSASVNGSTLTFDPGEAFQDLSAGETRDVTVSVQATDSQGATSEAADVIITVTGTNDVPVMEATVAAAEEDGAAISIDLASLGSDMDSEDDGDSLSYQILSGPEEGAASIDGTTFEFDPGEAFQDLSQGETRDVVVSVQATDAQGGVSEPVDITISVTGGNDAPTLAATAAAAAEDGSIVTVDLAPLGDDADGENDGSNLVYSIVSDTTGGPAPVDEEGNPIPGSDPVDGSFSIDGTNLRFDPGEGFQDLAEGETRDVIATLQATDAQGETSEEADVTVTVTGVNDAPTLEGTTAQAEEDGAAVEVDLSSLADDADSNNDGTNLSYAIIGAPDEGTATVDGTVLTFLPGDGFQDLGAGETRDVTVTVQATDAAGATSDPAEVLVTVTGVNDAPTLDVGGSPSEGIGSIVEDSKLSDSGSIPFEDADANDVPEATATTSSIEARDRDGGSLSLTAAQQQAIEEAFSVTTSSGKRGNSVDWDYEIDNTEIDFLANGESVTATFAVALTDAAGESASTDVRILIAGVNDEIIVTSADESRSVTEDTDVNNGDLTDTGKIAFDDGDFSDVHEFVADFVSSSNDGGQLGELTAILTADTTGSGTGGEIDWDYAVSNDAIQFLGDGDKITEEFNITTTDNQGSSVTTEIAVTINGQDGGLDGKVLQYQYVYPTIDDDYEGDLISPTNKPLKVGDSVELTVAGDDGDDIFTIDVSENQIEVDFLAANIWSDTEFNGFRLSDATDNIGDFSTASADDRRVELSVDVDDLFVDWGGEQFDAGDSFAITLNVAPEPVVVEDPAPVAEASSLPASDSTALSMAQDVDLSAANQA